MMSSFFSDNAKQILLIPLSLSTTARRHGNPFHTALQRSDCAFDKTVIQSRTAWLSGVLTRSDLVGVRFTRNRARKEPSQPQSGNDDIPVCAPLHDPSFGRPERAPHRQIDEKGPIVIGFVCTSYLCKKLSKLTMTNLSPSIKL